MSETVVAVDLGASSGRVMLAEVGPDRLVLGETFRFANTPVQVRQTLHWDILALYQGMLEGLRAAARLVERPASIGIDSWAVDYGLLDASGALLGNPVHYRDSRTDGIADKVLADIPAAELYATTGVQLLPFNTIFQLVAARSSLASAERLLLIPDLLSYWLTGVSGAEVTNASTTQLLDVNTGQWSVELMRRAGIRADLFAELRQPGDPAGELDVPVGFAGPVPVTAVGSHDTASAVVAVPAADDRFAYISCGTWSLVGLELPGPVLTEAGRAANFTNERGVDGTIRYLRNVMGLWLLQECLREWAAADRPGLRAPSVMLRELLPQAATLPARRSIVDPDLPVFLPPGDMPGRIAAECRRTGQPVPGTRAEFVRCVLDSLALAYRRTLADAQRLADRAVDVVHLVGGGTNNELLCQLTADACGLPVVAGPVEATALGNALVQARAVGAVGGGLGELRALIRRNQELRRYEPSGSVAAWAEAERRL